MSTSIQEQDLIQTIKHLEQRISDLERQQRTIATTTGASVNGDDVAVGLPVLGANSKGIEIRKDLIRLYTNNPSGDITAQMDITWDSWTNVINIPFLTALQAQQIAFVSVPATSTSSGTTGEIAANNTHLYVCTATNTWRRVALSTF
jgi:hypothetical protein